MPKVEVPRDGVVDFGLVFNAEERHRFRLRVEGVLGEHGMIGVEADGMIIQQMMDVDSNKATLAVGLLVAGAAVVMLLEQDELEGLADMIAACNSQNANGVTVSREDTNAAQAIHPSGGAQSQSERASSEGTAAGGSAPDAHDDLPHA
jgi:hypothetical protein